VTIVLAIANHNSGVGKTVTAANVSAGFARAGRRTLAVDCDAQANLTRWLLGRARVLAADGTLIARALGRLRPGYDAMVLDLPSSLGRLTVAALAAADGIVIPVTASVAGLHGLAGFRDWLASFRPDRSITAPVWGVLLTQADLDQQGRLRTWVGREVRDALADFRVTGARLLPVLVPRRVAEAAQ
jgi:chromosome partitioning protein